MRAWFILAEFLVPVQKLSCRQRRNCAIFGHATCGHLWITPFDTDQHHIGSRLPHLPWDSVIVPRGAQAHVHCFRCSMNTEDGAKLYDVCPHVSDSVRVVGGGGVLWPSVLWVVQEGGLLSRELVADLG